MITVKMLTIKGIKNQHLCDWLKYLTITTQNKMPRCMWQLRGTWIRTTVQILCTYLGNGDIKCSKTANKMKQTNPKKCFHKLMHSNCENTFCLPECDRDITGTYKSQKSKNKNKRTSKHSRGLKCWPWRECFIYRVT